MRVRVLLRAGAAAGIQAVLGGAAAAEVGLRLLLGRKLVFGNITLVDPTVNLPVGCSVETFEFIQKASEEFGVISFN